MCKKKIYISLPIAGKESTVFKRNIEAKEYCERYLSEYDVVSPIDENHIDDVALGNHCELSMTAKYMGRDIENVILCDAILMCPGWESSKGCKVEKYTAETYSKNILYYNGEQY